jgi:hypothetical protein
MNIDTKTLLVCDLIVGVFMCIWLLFYRVNQKAYAGFQLWLYGTLALTLGYVSTLLRLVAPLWVSVLGNNALLVFGLLARYDGTLMSLHEKRLPKAAYSLIGATVALALCFTIVHDSLPIRVLIFSLVSTGILTMNARLFLINGAANVPIYRVASLLYLIPALISALRPVIWLSSPHMGFFDNRPFQVVFYVSVALAEFFTQLSFVLINARRHEIELQAAHDKLAQTLTNLSATISEFKELSGILPICANCKRVRDESTWFPIETYLRRKGNADLRPSSCPVCQNKAKTGV